jgi:hypothetical protein
VSTQRNGREQGCRAPTKSGRPCKGFLLPGRNVCLSHAEDLAETVQRARARGGTAAAKIRALEGKRRRLEKPAELARFLSNLAEDTLSGTVDAGVARSVAYIAAVLRQVVETSDLAKRLEALEAAQQQGTGRWRA